ncbi:hypothetical protein SAMN05421803_1463 [Nocardiopsis flavescens]|uniref:Uncharacterized protein n=1 Tax=Nocardiopsis flavescens TaxID=758803 RepID=A0A1M6WL75_9ACTN|nr:hypothetical protein [Nocardiopsis flavescens]SHK94366.1 hypothetical protein SAMN05421803_1463 [Nocardiopsis flavescens]
MPLTEPASSHPEESGESGHVPPPGSVPAAPTINGDHNQVTIIVGSQNVRATTRAAGAAAPWWERLLRAVPLLGSLLFATRPGGS